MKWNLNDINFLYENYNKLTDYEISIKLDRKIESIVSKRLKLGLRKYSMDKILKICKNCKKEYYVSYSRITSEFCCKKCIHDYEKKNSGSIRICKICGKQYYTKGNPKTNNVCSKKCDGKNKMNGKIIFCKKCGKEIYRTPSVIKKNNFCSRTCANEYQKCTKTKLVCKVCNKEFFVYPSTIIHAEKRGWKVICCSNKCRILDPNNNLRLLKMNDNQNKNKNLNNLEKYGSKLLNDMLIEHKTQYLINDKISVDVYVEKYNLIIQWWGDYWHGHPSKIKNGIPDKRQQKRMSLDISQKKYLLKCGYKLLTFWEHEVYELTEIVKNNILGCL